MSVVETEESTMTLEKRVAEVEAASQRASTSTASLGSEVRRVRVHRSISHFCLLNTKKKKLNARN